MSLRDRKAPPSKRPRVKLLAETSGDVTIETLKQPPPPRVYTREEPGPLDIPQTIQMSFTPGRAWDPASILRCKADADGGNFQNAADLIESMLADTVIAGSLQLRVNALQGLPMRFVGGDEAVIEALSSDFWAMETAGEAAFRRTWGLMLNIVPNYTKRLDELDNRMVPRFEPWNPRWLSWQWSDRGIEYYMNTAGGRVKLTDQPGRWGLYCPQGFAGGRPWVHGLWYALATWWLAKSYAIADLAAFGQSHATPKWFLKQLEGTLMPGPEGEAAKRSAIRFLSKIPERSGMYVPYGFDVKQEETTSQAWQAITELIKIADIAMTKLILGSDAGTTANATYASSYTGEGVRTDLAVADDDADSSYMHDGPLRLWYGLNFRGTKRAQLQQGNVIEMLQDPLTRQYRMLSDRERRMPQRAFVRELSDRVRSGDEVPWPTRDITPPEDLAKIAQTQVSAADALVKLASAATADTSGAIGKALTQMDVPRYLSRYFPMSGDDESGVQLEDNEIELEDGTILELASKGVKGGGRWVTISGRHIMIPGGAKGKLKVGKDGAVTVGGVEVAVGASESKAEPVKQKTDAKSPEPEKTPKVEPKPEPAKSEPVKDSGADRDPSLDIKEFKKLPKEKAPWDDKKASITPDGSPEKQWTAAAKAKLDKATVAQRDAIETFTGSDFATIRKVQRVSKEDIKKEMFEDAKSMHESTFREKWKTPRDSNLYYSAKEGKGSTKDFNEWHKEKETTAKHIDSAFKTVEKSPGVVYRGLAVDEKTFNNLMSSDHMMVDAISSTSRDPKSAHGFTGGNTHRVVMKLRQKSGISVESASQYGNEKEIMLNKGTAFRVVKRSQIPGKGFDAKPTMVIEYEEI